MLVIVCVLTVQSTFNDIHHISELQIHEDCSKYRDMCATGTQCDAAGRCSEYTHFLCLCFFFVFFFFCFSLSRSLSVRARARVCVCVKVVDGGCVKERAHAPDVLFSYIYINYKRKKERKLNHPIIPC